MKFIVGENLKGKRKDVKIKILKKSIYLLYIALLVTWLACVILIFDKVHNIYPPDRYPKIVYEDLNQSEYEMAKNIIYEVNPVYMNGQKSITITKNLSKYYTSWFETKQKKDEKIKNLAGYNDNENIYILFNESEAYLKEVLCHELIHSFTLSNKQSHEVVYDLAESLPCYFKDYNYIFEYGS